MLHVCACTSLCSQGDRNRAQLILWRQMKREVQNRTLTKSSSAAGS